MPRYVKFFLIISCAILTASPLYAGGLSSYFVEVKLENLKPGRTYSVKGVTGKPLVVTNTTDNVTVDIAVEAEKPSGANLVAGYEPIPNLSWIKIKKAYFKEIGPKGSIETDITIDIPPNKRYHGKKYQVYIYSHTAGDNAFRVGLMGRILFEVTNPAPRVLRKTFSFVGARSPRP